MSPRLESLIDWFCRRPSPCPKWASEFSYSNGLELLDGPDFQFAIEHGGEVREMKLLSSTEEGDTETCVFEGVDEITALRYRCAWTVTWRGDAILGILAANVIIPPEPQNVSDRFRHGLLIRQL